MRPLPLLAFALVFGCAGTSSRPLPEIVRDCPAAMAAEKDHAAKEGREPVPIVQKGRLLTDVRDVHNRPQITPAMFGASNGAPLTARAIISVGADGRVESVELVRRSGVPAFDEALVAKMKKWRHQPYVINCQPAPYRYPMNYEDRLGR